jgi:hypothetical protein
MLFMIVMLQGLEALDDIATNQPIIEYKGMVMMKAQYMKENNFHSKYVVNE